MLTDATNLARRHSLLPLEATKPLFVSMMTDKARAIGEIATVISLLAKRGERGREVRFGNLSIPAERNQRPASDAAASE
jgi:hypothetical protein